MVLASIEHSLWGESSGSAGLKKWKLSCLSDDSPMWLLRATNLTTCDALVAYKSRCSRIDMSWLSKCIRVEESQRMSLFYLHYLSEINPSVQQNLPSKSEKQNKNLRGTNMRMLSEQSIWRSNPSPQGPYPPRTTTKSLLVSFELN